MTEYRFQTAEPIDLEVTVPIGEIDVETVDGDESLVTVEGNEKLVEQTIVELRGNRLVVELRGRKPFGITIAIGDFSFGNGGLRVHARIPHASRAALATASADMKVRGRIESLDSKSASGDLTVVGTIERDAAIKTVSGDAHVQRIDGNLRATTVSGDLFLGSVGRSIEIKSVSGDVRVESVREGSATVQSVSGDIELGVAAGTNLDVDAGSVSGELDSEVPLGSDRAAADADGPTLVVRGKTVSGDFRVFRAA